MKRNPSLVQQRQPLLRLSVLTALTLMAGNLWGTLKVQAEPHTNIAATQPSAGDRQSPTKIQFYGEVREPNQVGKGYLVFQQSGHQTVGAVYYPRSEYQCFIGQSHLNQLQISFFENGAAETERVQVPLTDLHAIPQVGENERRILAACQQDAIALEPLDRVPDRATAQYPLAPAQNLPL